MFSVAAYIKQTLLALVKTRPVWGTHESKLKALSSELHLSHTHAISYTVERLPSFVLFLIRL